MKDDIVLNSSHRRGLDGDSEKIDPKDPIVKRLQANKLRLGDRRDDYELSDMIGRGSFGYVFLAYSKHGDKPRVAIKKIDKETLLNQYNHERLISEIMIHLNMKHVNIVELYLYFEEQGGYYLVMELCENGDMFKLLRKCKKFNEAQTRHYFVQLLNALIYLQSFGVIHRDLKVCFDNFMDTLTQCNSFLTFY